MHQGNISSKEGRVARKRLTGEEFVVAYPVGTRIMWRNRQQQPHHWFSGIVVEAERKTNFDPCVWFMLDIDTDGIPRWLAWNYQHLMKKEECLTLQ